MNALHTLSSGTAWMQIILSLSRCLSWLIVCVNLTAPHDAKYLVKHYLWVCPWRCFWKRLAFSALLSRLSKAYFPPPWQYIIQSIEVLFSSAQFSSSVVSNSLWPHKPHHARPPCPLATPGVYSNSCPSSRWCHPAISSSVIPFSSCPHSFPASGSFQMSQLFASGGQSIGVSASTSALPMNTQVLNSQ